MIGSNAKRAACVVSLPDYEIRTCQSLGGKAPGLKMPLELLAVAEEVIK
jgi:hypothetical protein